MDFYNTLQVPKNATINEIKQSYKKLVLQYHPDKGGDIEMFKKIQEAYETLSDPEQRRVYDHHRHNNGIHLNFHNGFMNFFHQFHRPTEHINITTTFEELYTLFEKTIDLPYHIQIQYPIYKQKLHINGEPTNFLITNKINLPEEFQLINQVDLLFKKEISLCDALGGLVFDIHLPTEILHLKKNAIIKDGEVVVIQNKGILLNQNQRGNLLIKFVLIYPELNEEKLKVLKTLI